MAKAEQSPSTASTRPVGLTLSPQVLETIQQDYVKQAAHIWSQAMSDHKALTLSDRRFSADAWRESSMASFLAAMYLLNTETLKRMGQQVEGDLRSKERLNFALSQWADAASPANYFAFNPEALQLAIQTQGQSLSRGVGQLLHDMVQGHMSQTDESVFGVGNNLAVTPGDVIFENDFFQLIEYRPTTEKVKAVPFLFVPPCINKFYILDLTPENSMVRYLVEQGHRVFMMSWANASESLAHATWDDYAEHGVMKAIDVVREVAKVPLINALGFCIGGTLLSTALASLAARGEKPIRSLTLLTSLLDFEDTGVMDVLVDEAMVSMREMTMGATSQHGGGLMKGADLATTFSFLRPNDLVWNYVVSNYLKGQAPPAFDLLYWNSDSTNLPGPMYCWYLRNTYLENKLKAPGTVQVCGEPLDFSSLDMPTFIYGSREDHIVPWQSAYASGHLLSGQKTFVLGASGHIAGVINPPQKNKRSFWHVPSMSTNVKPAALRQLVGQTVDNTDALAWQPAQEWLSAAQEQSGSWWPTWMVWLGHYAGDWIPAPVKAGNRKFAPIEPAPGRYVKKRA